MTERALRAQYEHDVTTFKATWPHVVEVSHERNDDIYLMIKSLRIRLGEDQEDVTWSFIHPLNPDTGCFTHMVGFTDIVEAVFFKLKHA